MAKSKTKTKTKTTGSKTNTKTPDFKTKKQPIYTDRNCYY